VLATGILNSNVQISESGLDTATNITGTHFLQGSSHFIILAFKTLNSLLQVQSFGWWYLMSKVVELADTVS
jgi:hypothetical protein